MGVPCLGVIFGWENPPQPKVCAIFSSFAQIHHFFLGKIPADEHFLDKTHQNDGIVGFFLSRTSLAAPVSVPWRGVLCKIPGGFIFGGVIEFLMQSGQKLL